MHPLLPLTLMRNTTAVTILDADGDGEITAKDLVIYWRQAKAVLERAVPSAGGFAAGMALGLWYA
jgi:hypothetical protein